MNLTLEQQVQHAAAMAAVAKSNGDEHGEEYWWNETIRLADMRDRANQPRTMCAPASFYARPAS